MYCIKCGKEIQSEFNNCPYCGAPIQIVPDYSIYDDDNINVLLEGSKNVESKNNKAYIRAEKEKKRLEAMEQKKKAQTKKIVTIVSFACGVLLVLAIGGKILLDMNQASSYDYQMKMASKAMFHTKYEEAEEYFLNALELEPQDIKVRLELAELYVKTKDSEEAIKLLKEVVQLDATNFSAYKQLYTIYDEAGMVEEILALKNTVTDEKLLGIFSEYETESPKFSLESGNYTTEITVSLSADKDIMIYYTLDGTDPVSKGKIYRNSIVINEAGMHTIKAVAKNSLGIYSSVVSSTYMIEHVAPEDPVVTPNGGEFFEETLVSIVVPEGCSAYYTWEDETPSETSTLYVSPIEIPEGYHILSVIIMDDETGLESGIYRGAFEYHPE